MPKPQTDEFGGIRIDPEQTKQAVDEFGGTRVDSPPEAEQEDKPGFFSSAWDTIKHGPLNLVEDYKGLNKATNEFLQHPIQAPVNAIKAIGQSNANLGNKAIAAVKSGNPIEAVQAGTNALINSVVPGLGEQSQHAGERLQSGDIRGGLGETAGLGFNTAAMLESPNIVRGIRAAPSAMRGLTKINPEVASEQAFRPTAADAEFPKVAPPAFSDVKAFGGSTPKTMFGQPKVGVEQIAPGGNTSSAIESMQTQGMEPWLARARQAGVTVRGDEIVNATRNAIPQLMWTKDPAGAKALIDEAQRTWGGKQFSPDEFRDFLKTGNAGLSRFYKQAPTAQGAAATAGSPPAINEAEISGIRNALYKTLDPEGQGAGPQQVQERTGNVINLRNAAERRSNSILGERPVTPLRAAMRVGMSPFELASAPFRSNPEYVLNRALHPIRGGADALIQSLYRQAPEAEPLPLPGGAYPRASASHMIGPPSIVTPPPADTSFVRSAPLTAEQQTTRMLKALPPGTAPFTQGTSVPDIMGQARTAMGRDINGPRRIEPPNPQRQPIHLPTTQGTYPGELPPTASTPQPMGASGPAMPPSVKTSGIQTPVPRFAPIPYEAPAEENLGIRIDPQTGKLIIRGLQ